MFIEELVEQARRNTGYLCHEGTLVHRIEELKAEREKLIEAVVKAAIPLEAINASVEWELEDAIKWEVQEAIDAVRAVLQEVKK